MFLAILLQLYLLQKERLFKNFYSIIPYQNWVLLVIWSQIEKLNLNSEMANCCTMFKVRHSTRTSPTLLTNWLVESKKNLGAHLRMFSKDTFENWSFQVLFSVYAHNTQPLSHLHVSPYQNSFSNAAASPIEFSLNFLGMFLAIAVHKKVLIYHVNLITNSLI